RGRWCRCSPCACARWWSSVPDGCSPAWPPSTSPASTPGTPKSCSLTSPDLDLTGKTALVTGGGKGIGRAVSEALGAMGARVVVNYRSDQTAAEATAAGLANGEIYQADVGNADEVEAMV